MPQLAYIHAIMLAISEFKQIYLRLPEINQENDQINLSNLAKKHLNELISKDVCVIFFGT